MVRERVEGMARHRGLDIATIPIPSFGWIRNPLLPKTQFAHIGFTKIIFKYRNKGHKEIGYRLFGVSTLGLEAYAP